MAKYWVEKVKSYNKNRYGSIILNDKNGDEFRITKKEQQEMKMLVKRANSKREYYANKYYNDVIKNSNMKGVSKEVYKKLLTKKGFISETFSTSFNQFSSKDDYKDFIKELRQINKKGYYQVNKSVKAIRESLNKQLNRLYGNQAKPIKDLIKSISDSDLMSLYIHNDEIIKDLYYSDSDVDSFVDKTESDIMVALMEIRR